MDQTRARIRRYGKHAFEEVERGLEVIVDFKINDLWLWSQ